jgi:hypothetical protein
MTPDCDFVNDENLNKEEVALGVTSLIINDSNLINKMSNFAPMKTLKGNLPYVYPE